MIVGEFPSLFLLRVEWFDLYGMYNLQAAYFTGFGRISTYCAARTWALETIAGQSTLGAVVHDSGDANNCTLLSCHSINDGQGLPIHSSDQSAGWHFASHEHAHYAPPNSICTTLNEGLGFRV